MSGVVVVGVGNIYRGDDAAGLAVVQRLADRVPEGVVVVPCEQEPTRLLEAWEDARAAVVVDAVSSGGEAGAVHRFDASADALPETVFRSSTHAFGVGETLELARALGKLPGTVLVYGVEGGSFAASEGLTPAVDAAVDRVVAAVAEDLERLVREEEPCTNGR